MEQRRLRLGDILDDYCPRERRVTNHAIVAMIEEDIKQTRCTTCDAEHAYKGAKLPRRRKKETPAALYKEVLAGMPETEGAPVLAAPAAIPVDVDVAPQPRADDDEAPRRSSEGILGRNLTGELVGLPLKDCVHEIHEFRALLVGFRREAHARGVELRAVQRIAEADLSRNF